MFRELDFLLLKKKTLVVFFHPPPPPHTRQRRYSYRGMRRASIVKEKYPTDCFDPSRRYLLFPSFSRRSQQRGGVERSDEDNSSSSSENKLLQSKLERVSLVLALLDLLGLVLIASLNGFWTCGENQLRYCLPSRILQQLFVPANYG